MRGKLNTVDADTLLSTPMGKTLFLIDRLLPQGMHILCGAGKIGKSWMMLRLCLQVANGEPLWGLITHRCDVLYLCLEDTFTRIQTRLYALTDNAPENLRFAVLCGQIGGGLTEQITDFLVDYPETKLIVIDTLQKVRDARGSKNGMYGSDYEDIASLKAIADQHGIAIVAVHHLRKLQDTDDPFNQVSGTTGLTGAVDSSFVLKKDNRAANTAVLLATGRDIEYQQLVLRFDEMNWQLVERRGEDELRHDEVPVFLFRLAEFMESRANWTGTATELLAVMDDGDTKPAVVTKMLSRYFYDVLEPCGIQFTTRRTGKCREIRLTRSDDSDANDGQIHIAKTPSRSSLTVTQNPVF